MNAIVSPARGRKLAAACLAAAALAPFGASLAFHAAGPVAQAGARSVERPALVFEQYLVNLREIPPMQEASARFAFANLGDEPLTITALEPGCGCLSPRLEKRTYRAGESGEFFVRIQTASEKPGRKEYAVTVRYTDPVPRETKLIFKVTLPERQVLVEPRGLIVYQFGDAPPPEREIMVTDYRGRALNVVRAEISTPLASARVTARDADADGHPRTRIAVQVAGDLPRGVHRGLVTIHTSDAAFPRLHVPLLIERR